MRVYNPSLGKFLSVDPLTKDFPWYTPYQFAGNKPIWAIDLDGAEEWLTNDGTTAGPYSPEYAESQGWVSFQGPIANAVEITSSKPQWANENDVYQTSAGTSSAEFGKSHATAVPLVVTLGLLGDGSGAAAAGGAGEFSMLGPLAAGTAGVLALDYYMTNYGIWAPPAEYVNTEFYYSTSTIPLSEQLKRTFARDRIRDLWKLPKSPERGYVYVLTAPETGPYVCHTCAGGMVILNQGDIWKIGFSTNPNERYSAFSYENRFLMTTVYQGFKYDALAVEKGLLLSYWYLNQNVNRSGDKGGRSFLPPGNKIYR